MKIRQRTKNLIVAGVVGAIVMGVISSGGIVYVMKQNANEKREMRVQYESQLNESQKLLQEQQSIMKTVVVASKELEAGAKLTKGDLKTIQVPETEAPSNMIQNENDLIGKFIKIDVGQRTPLISSMLFDEAPTPRDLRIKEYDVITLPTKLEKGHFLDIRISFPTGQEYIVLAKKKVKDMSSSIVWFDVNESEQQLMNSAIVDAYLQGAQITASTYPDPYMQDEAIPNYPANAKVIDLIQSNPNVLKTAKYTLRKVARSNLEKNLSQISEADKIKIQNGSLISNQQSMNNDASTTVAPIEQGSAINNSNVVPKEEIVQPKDDDSASTVQEEKQNDVFQQPLVK